MPRQKTIDHISYPHILDLIISFADPRALQALRLTCHQYNRTITHRLSRHLILHEDGCLTSRDGSLVIWRHTPHRLNSQLAIPNPDHLDRLLPLVKALDIRRISGHKLMPLLPQLDIVRIDNCRSPIESIPTSHTLICRGMVFLQSRVERLIIYDRGITSVMTRNRMAVGEIVVLCIGGKWGQKYTYTTVATKLATLLCGGVHSAEVICGRITIVNAEDYELLLLTLHQRVAAMSRRAVWPVNLDEVELQFVSWTEYVQSLSPLEVGAIDHP